MSLFLHLKADTVHNVVVTASGSRTDRGLFFWVTLKRKL